MIFHSYVSLPEGKRISSSKIWGAFFWHRKSERPNSEMVRWWGLSLKKIGGVNMKNGEKPSRRISKPGISANKNAVFWVCLKMWYLKMTIFRWKMMINQWLWAPFQTNIVKPIAHIFAILTDVHPCKCGKRICLSIHGQKLYNKNTRNFLSSECLTCCPRNILMVIAG